MTTAGTDLFGGHRIGLIKGPEQFVCGHLRGACAIVFRWALEAGMSKETILWVSAAGMVAISWPMSVLLCRG